MDQQWFEMPEVRRHWLSEAVWIPLCSSEQLSVAGKYGDVGYCAEYYGTSSIVVSLDERSGAEGLRWIDVMTSGSHEGWIGEDRYHECDEYAGRGSDEFSGQYLVLEQHFNSIDGVEWHLHQDLTTTLDLKREGDSWVRPSEDYVEVVRLKRDESGKPVRLEMRSCHLRDYLCARGAALYVVSYRSRAETVEDASFITWDPNPQEQRDERDEWRAGVYPIHEGGASYGGGIVVMSSAWADEFMEGDVPMLGLPDGGNIESETWEATDPGRKLYHVEGELWRTEWIEPGDCSPIVAHDETDPVAFFVVDAAGKREGKDTLSDGGRWLWFRPEIVAVLAHRRGGSLRWYTRDTGAVACSPNCDVHFGVNALGLVTVYAKDVAQLPDWQQLLWAGQNVPPEGGVSEELKLSQIKAAPADTQAPEQYLEHGLRLLNEASDARLGIRVVRPHQDASTIIERCHRFRSTCLPGLLELAKDLARLTADGFDANAIQTIAPSPKGEKRGSLKSLEAMIATSVGAARARRIMGPLHGIYQLRLADAHLPSDNLDEGLALVGVDKASPYVLQGYQLMHACVGTLYAVAEVISRMGPEVKDQHQSD